MDVDRPKVLLARLPWTPCRFTRFSTLNTSKPELRVDVLGDPVVLDQAHVDVDEPRVAERCSGSSVPFLARSRLRERGPLEHAVDVVLPIEAVGHVGRRVREVEVHAVRIVIAAVRCEAHDRTVGPQDGRERRVGEDGERRAALQDAGAR